MLDKDLEVEYIESSDGVRNFHNVIKQAKADYDTKGFTITIWKLGTQDQYGKARCY